MPRIEHPAYEEEQAHLEKTLRLVKDQLDLHRVEFDQAQDEMDRTFKMSRDDVAAIELRSLLLERSRQIVRNLTLATDKPYFTRVDFREEGAGLQSFYIGRHTVMKPDELEPEIFDWRAPVANLYYSGQVGPMSFIAPEGEISGELTLKRQFRIDRGILEAIFDTGLVSNDQYLQDVLGASTGDRLRDIVTTIQAEQNDVIRHPISASLIVQGVAGSGKTTIALHRIAYLLYTYQDELSPENFAILAPNPLFLNFIAGVLPDLGVERVRQTTYTGFMRDWLGDILPPVDESDMTETVLGMSPVEQDTFARLMRYKGSVDLIRQLDAFLDRREALVPPDEEIRFGPVTLFTAQQLKKRFLSDERPFPWTFRIDRIKSDLTVRTEDAAKKLIEWFNKETERREEALEKSMPAGEALRLRLVKLLGSRDQRISETRAKVKPFIASVMEKFPRCDAMDLYRDFLEDMAGDDPGSAASQAASYTLRRLDRGVIDREDIAPIAVIAMRLFQLNTPDMRHLVIDEAQDFSPAEFAIMKRMSPRATMTIVGDTMQGIRSWRGIDDWQELNAAVFSNNAVIRQLTTSYRSTVEIIETASIVAASFPAPGQVLPRPVLRHGERVKAIQFDGAFEQAQIIADTVLKWRADGLNTIAAIFKSRTEMDAVMQLLPKSLKPGILDVASEAYTGGFTLALASEVKGFEFDGVIIANAGEDNYLRRPLDARLLYVGLTRPLHRLICLYEGRLSSLLSSERS